MDDLQIPLKPEIESEVGTNSNDFNTDLTPRKATSLLFSKLAGR